MKILLERIEQQKKECTKDFVKVCITMPSDLLCRLKIMSAFFQTNSSIMCRIALAEFLRVMIKKIENQEQ